jgi:hypothetical protein
LSKQPPYSDSAHIRNVRINDFAVSLGYARLADAAHQQLGGPLGFLDYLDFMTDEAAAEFKSSLNRTEEALPDFIGLHVEEAIELAQRLDLELRVIRIGANEWHTADQRANRVTIEVEDGVVTRARVE